MKNRRLNILYLIAALLTCNIAQADRAELPIMIHSHNDYLCEVPFYEAYSQGANSIEVDIHHIDGKLLVGHTLEELSPLKSFESLYVEPIVKLFELNNGTISQDKERSLQLLVELKSETKPTLNAVTKILDKYPNIFNTALNPKGVRVVITGRVPSPNEFKEYPSYIMFDGSINQEYTAKELERVALFSQNFKSYSSWNGKGLMLKEDQQRVEAAIAKAHEMGRPIRFWWAPDGVSVWYTFYNMGVNYLSPNNFGHCVEVMRDYHKKYYKIGSINVGEEGVAQAKKLDKATRSFKGFDNDKLRISQPIETYMPKYKCDGSKKKIKNVILMIGDGMGLTQMFATKTVNKDLTLFNIKHLGLQLTAANDAFTTDSAAAGSALATGEKHNNRHISADENNNPVESISEIFHNNGYKCGVVTLGSAVDATPTAFYGHYTERDSSNVFTRQLLDRKIDLLCGSGYNDVFNINGGIDMKEELSKYYNIATKVDDINSNEGPTLCLDDEMGDAACEQNLELLANATKQSIDKLQEDNSKGFFLMVEAAKIDYAGHARSLPGVVVETLSFDLAVAEALRFADQDGQTLVIITGDHETGGLVIVDGNNEQGSVMGYFLTDDHTATPLPVLSYGPSAQEFIGVYENTEIVNRIKKLLNF